MAATVGTVDTPITVDSVAVTVAIVLLMGVSNFKPTIFATTNLRQKFYFIQNL